MKKLFYCIMSLLMMSYSSIAQTPGEKIGAIENGKFVITSDLKGIKENWNAILKSQKIEEEVTEFEILSGTEQENESAVYYMLIGRTEKKDSKLALLLDLDDNTFVISTSKIKKGTCSCTGCSSACDPVWNGSRWYCTSGCYPSESCSKTVTIQSSIQ